MRTFASKLLLNWISSKLFHQGSFLRFLVEGVTLDKFSQLLHRKSSEAQVPHGFFTSCGVMKLAFSLCDECLPMST